MNEATPIRPTRNVELGASAEPFQNLHEFIRKARANLNQNAWDYIVGAAETETTMRRNRMALDEMLRHRQRLLADLKSRTGFDMSLPIRNVSEDIAAIEAGLVELRGEVPATAPRVDWS